MGFGYLLKKGLQEVGKAIKKSYNEEKLGDSVYRAMIETLVKKEIMLKLQN